MTVDKLKIKKFISATVFLIFWTKMVVPIFLHHANLGNKAPTFKPNHGLLFAKTIVMLLYSFIFFKRIWDYFNTYGFISELFIKFIDLLSKSCTCLISIMYMALSLNFLWINRFFYINEMISSLYLQKQWLVLKQMKCTWAARRSAMPIENNYLEQHIQTCQQTKTNWMSLASKL